MQVVQIVICRPAHTMHWDSTMHWGTALCYISAVQATLFYTGMQILPKLKGTLDEDTTADTLTGDLEDQESI